MKCLNCQKPVSDKAKYCSDKCRMSYTRRTKQGDLPEHLEPEQPTRTTTTPTDTLFEARRPNYYRYEEKTLDNYCLNCGRDFSTRLKLLQFCSPDCQQTMLGKLTGAKSV